MSISGALSNALSGLTAAARSGSVVTSNVANSLNEGYGRREVELGTRAVGSAGGVQVVGVTRHVDAKLVHELRMADSEHNHSDTIVQFRNRMEELLGTPEDGFSLSAQIADLENSLISAASRPDLPERLDAVLTASQRVSDTFNDASQGIQTLREEADAEIAATVNRLNELLKQTQELNASISGLSNSGGDTAGLMDHRQAVIDEISSIVPVREMPRDGGVVALLTPGGTFLIDGTAGEFGFEQTNVITPYQTIDNTFLSGLTLNGRDISTATGDNKIGGGRLAALFEIRDDLAIEAQSRLDVAARDLIERFQDPSLDATRNPGDPGLFTDGGSAFSATDELGISARLEINALVDPAQGGATWRLRDGLGATSAGPPGDNRLLTDLLDKLSEKRLPASASFGSAGVSASGLASSLLSLVGTERQLAEQSHSFSSARRTELNERLLAGGVDTDQEMQRMMMIEQAYAANARMLQTIDQMMNTLMEL